MHYTDQLSTNQANFAFIILNITIWYTISHDSCKLNKILFPRIKFKAILKIIKKFNVNLYDLKRKTLNKYNHIKHHFMNKKKLFIIKNYKKKYLKFTFQKFKQKNIYGK